MYSLQHDHMPGQWSNNAILAALRRMGYDKDTMTGHGFRAWPELFSMRFLQVRPDFIEHQLAHCRQDPNREGLQSTAHLGKTEDDATVADYLDGLKTGSKGIADP